MAVVLWGPRNGLGILPWLEDLSEDPRPWDWSDLQQVPGRRGTNISAGGPSRTRTSPNKARGELERTGRAEARTTEGVLGLRQQVVQAEQGILHPSTLLLFSAS